MKNFISFLGFVIVSFCAQAQQVQSVQLPALSSDITFGDNVVTVVHNPHGVPVIFFPLLQVGERDIPQDLFLSKDNLVAWLIASCEDVSEEDCILAMSLRFATLLKSDMFRNASASPDVWSYLDEEGQISSDFEQVFAKEFSLIGSYSGYYTTKCGEFAQRVPTLFEQTGLIAPGHVRIVGGGHHIFVEIFHDDKWKIVDFDPSMGMFLSRNHLSHHELRQLGWPDALNEIVPWKFQSFFTGDSTFSYYPDGDVSPWINSMFTYFQALTTDTVNTTSVPLDYPVYEMTGEFIIPAGAKIEVPYIEDCLRIDTLVNPELSAEMIDWRIQLQSALMEDDSVGISDALFGIGTMFQNHFSEMNFDLEFLFDRYIFNDGFVFGGEKFFPVFKRDEIPYCTVVLVPGYYVIGQDLKIPGKVLSIEASLGSEIYLADGYGNDTLVIGGFPYEADLWLLGDEEIVPNNANHYLQQGWVSAADTLRIKVSLNPVISNFLHGTLELETDQPLDVECWINGTSVFDTLIVNVDEKKILSVYPNPVTSEINFPSGDVILYDMYGRIVSTCSNCASLSVAGFSKGLYILNHTSGNARIMIQ
jgi:hypothetical protein